MEAVILLMISQIAYVFQIRQEIQIYIFLIWQQE